MRLRLLIVVDMMMMWMCCGCLQNLMTASTIMVGVVEQSNSGADEKKLVVDQTGGRIQWESLTAKWTCSSAIQLDYIAGVPGSAAHAKQKSPFGRRLEVEEMCSTPRIRWGNSLTHSRVPVVGHVWAAKWPTDSPNLQAINHTVVTDDELTKKITVKITLLTSVDRSSTLRSMDWKQGGEIHVNTGTTRQTLTDLGAMFADKKVNDTSRRARVREEPPRMRCSAIVPNCAPPA